LESIIRITTTITSIVKSGVNRFNEDRCFRVASALSFTTLLSLVPLITVIVSTLSMFPVFETWTETVETFIYQNFVPTAGESVKGYLHEFSDKAGELTAVGLVFLMISSLLLLATIEDAFNDIWRIQQGRPFFQRLIIYWTVITLGPLLTAISLSMSSAMLSTMIFSNQSLLADATQFVLRYIPILFELGAYVLFYKAIPNTEVKFHHALIGAVIATILFELTKQGFAFYISNFKSYQLIYGALAIIPIFFIWVYLCWLVMLVGAVIAAVLKTREAENIQVKSENESINHGVLNH
jgi:membrane protein